MKTTTKILLLLALTTSTLFSATYEVKKKEPVCKDGFEEKFIQTNKTYYSYQIKRYKSVCVEVKKVKGN